MEAQGSERFQNLTAAQLMQVDACVRCGECVEQCPVFGAQNDVSDTSVMKIQALRSYIRSSRGILALIFRNRAKKNAAKHLESILDHIYRCTTCAGCKEVCPIAIDTTDLWESCRAELVSQSLAPGEKHRALQVRVEAKNNPYNEPPEKRDAWTHNEIRTAMTGDVGYFTGCTASYRRQEIATATGKVLNHIGIEPVILGPEEYCCGSPLIRTGQIFLLERLVKHNVEEFKKRGVKEVLHSCAGCYRTMVMDWPKYYGKQLPFKTRHIVEYLLERSRKGELKYVNRLDGTLVTYHDPCHLGRHLGIYEAPRELIRSFPGVTLVEMDRNLNMSRCCGAGGGVKSGYSDLAMEMAVIRLKDVETDVLTTACPFCSTNLKDAAKASGSSIKVLEILEILAYLLGLVSKPDV